MALRREFHLPIAELRLLKIQCPRCGTAVTYDLRRGQDPIVAHRCAACYVRWPTRWDGIATAFQAAAREIREAEEVLGKSEDGPILSFQIISDGQGGDEDFWVPRSLAAKRLWKREEVGLWNRLRKFLSGRFRP